MENIIYFFTKLATLMRRSTVLSLPLQLVFPGVNKGKKTIAIAKNSSAKNLSFDELGSVL